MRKYIVILFFTLLSVNNSVTAADWRYSAKNNDKLNKLIEVMPGASVIMQQMGERYRNLYWSGKMGRWKFAEYQIEEMQDLIQTLIITRPKRAKTANKFMQTAFELYPAAIEEKSWKKFRAAFENMRNQCMICHVNNKHAFVVLPKQPRKGNSPVLETDSE